MGAPGRGNRPAAVRVRGRHRKPSSAAWLTRQLNDPYVAEAKRAGLRSRAAFKLVELDQRFRLLRPGLRVVDLGSAPGGWSQIAAARVGPRGHVVGVDLRPVETLPGVQLIEGDFADPAVQATLRSALGGAADLVLSDMAAPATGHAATDHLRILALAEAAFDFAQAVLAPGGGFVAKVYQGGAAGPLLARLKRAFAEVRHAKPPASRAESAETYVVARRFRGPA